jgi:hypothetical protein
MYVRAIATRDIERRINLYKMRKNGMKKLPISFMMLFALKLLKINQDDNKKNGRKMHKMLH